MQRTSIVDNGFFTLRKNKKIMTIIKTPFKSLPAIHNEKNHLVRAGSEGSTIPKAVDLSSVVRPKKFRN